MEITTHFRLDGWVAIRANGFLLGAYRDFDNGPTRAQRIAAEGQFEYQDLPHGAAAMDWITEAVK